MQIMSGNTKCKVAYFSGGSRLPNAFQEVEYLESTGGQYIDTGVSGNERMNTPIIEECICLFTQTKNGTQYQGWGGYNRSHYGVKSSGFYTLDGGVDSSINAIGIKRKLIATYLEKSMELNINNEYTVIRSNTTTVAIPNAAYTLFGSNNVAFGCYMKMYEDKIYIQGTLVRNFVPCYRKADNVAGLYDLVNGVFYTNAGTGTFLKGNNVQALAPLKCQVH